MKGDDAGGVPVQGSPGPRNQSDSAQPIAEAERPSSASSGVTCAALWLTSLRAAAACTVRSGAQARGPPSISPAARSRAVSRQHFTHVEQAMLTTVAGVTNIGPRPVHPRQGRLTGARPARPWRCAWSHPDLASTTPSRSCWPMARLTYAGRELEPALSC